MMAKSEIKLNMVRSDAYYKHDNNGRIVEIKAFDQFNQPIKENFTYDFPFILNDREAVEYLSNIDNIKIKYYDNGLVKTATIDNNDYNFTYDDKKRSISFSALNTITNKAINIEANVKKIHTPTRVFEHFSPSSKYYKYDNEGKLIEIKALDKNLNITLTTKYDYIDSGNYLIQSLWVNDEPAETDTTGHITRYQFDENDNKKEIRYFNINNKPTKDELNCAVWKYDNDDYGRVLSRACYDEQDNPSESTYNYHRKNFIYSIEDNYIESVLTFKTNNNQTYYNYTNFTNSLRKKIEPEDIKKEIVYLDTKPSGALVYNNDKLIGVTPLKEKPHSNLVRLEKDGYNSIIADTLKSNKIILTKSNKMVSEKDVKFNESVNNILNNINIEASIEALLELSNDKYGQAALALYYWFLNTNQTDNARFYLFRAIELEDAEAIGTYAFLLTTGDVALGIDKNTELAHKFALKTIEKDHVLGYNALGMIYYFQEDYLLANKNFHNSCNKGSKRPTVPIICHTTVL